MRLKIFKRYFKICALDFTCYNIQQSNIVFNSNIRSKTKKWIANDTNTLLKKWKHQ